MNEEVKLSREERTQLEAANAEALGNEIAGLSGHYQGGLWNYKAFWIHSDRIHDLFKRMTPLKKSDRARLWEAFTAAREVVREKQDGERRYHQWLFEKKKEAVQGCMEELEELLEKPSKEDPDIEQILFLQDSIRLMSEPGWQGYPDTPDVALLSTRLHQRASDKENSEIKRVCSKLRRKAAKFLEKGAEEKFAELTICIDRIKSERGRTGVQKLKSRLREFRNRVLCPILLREQKEQLLKRAEEMLEGAGGLEDLAREEPEQAAPGTPVVQDDGGNSKSAAPAPTPGSVKAPAGVDAILSELEMSVARKKG